MTPTAPVRDRVGIAAVCAAALICAASLAWLDRASAPALAASRARAQWQVLAMVLPSLRPGDVPDGPFPLADLGCAAGGRHGAAWIVRRAGQAVAVVLDRVEAAGYSGPVAVTVGTDPEGRVLAVRIAGHRETAGLGDRIGATRWLDAFAGATIADAWEPRSAGGDFQALSGATISSAAVMRASAAALGCLQRVLDRHAVGDARGP
ncbi:MAG: FMN-binding protein [Gammaproteobacteria bacterium]